MDNISKNPSTVTCSTPAHTEPSLTSISPLGQTASYKQPVHNILATYCSYVVLWFWSVSSASQQGDPSCISGHSMCELWYTTWHCDRFLREGYFLSPLLISFRPCSIPTSQSCTGDATKLDFSTPSGRGQNSICINRLTDMRGTKYDQISTNPTLLGFPGAFAKPRKKNYELRHVRLSIYLSAWDNSVLTARIFMKFDIWVFFEICGMAQDGAILYIAAVITWKIWGKPG